jgi:Protein chain release factor B
MSRSFAIAFVDQSVPTIGTRDRRFQRAARTRCGRKRSGASRAGGKRSGDRTRPSGSQAGRVRAAPVFVRENDRANAFVTIHSGAGGTESCDWADMLLRMYQRWIERSGFKSQTVDIQQGEEVGIKSVTLLVTGEYGYGICKPSAACTGLCASRRLTRINGGTHHSRASTLCPKSPTLRRLKLIRPISRSARFAAAAKADRT